jgi:NAD(P)-dependent dehydrogenase (short-subunit alcohol dehydrogenase family)
MGRFDEQVAVVTGAGGGLGREYALLLANEGARVVVNDYGGDSQGNRGTSAAADAVVTAIEAAGGEAVADSNDVAEDGVAVVSTALEAFGRVDIVINNAGIAGGGDLDTISVEDYERMLAIHLGGTLAVSRAAWQVFRAQGYGRIVNTSSASVFGIAHTSAYITAKGAIFALTRALGLDGRDIGIKVNGIMPAAYSRLTAQSPELAPLMEASFPASAVAPFACMLASPDVPCSGETFVVGGGRAARVVLGTTTGVTGLDTIERCLAEVDRVLDTDGMKVFDDAFAEVLYECQQLGIDLGGFGSAEL